MIFSNIIAGKFNNRPQQCKYLFYRNTLSRRRIDVSQAFFEPALYHTDKPYEIGKVHEGDPTMDWMEQEKECGITITSAGGTTGSASLTTNPGHMDFMLDVEWSLFVLDRALSVFDNVMGVEPQADNV